MPIAEEMAVIEVQGRRFENWETVWVHREFPGEYAKFRFTFSEEDPAKAAWTLLQIKPGDFCKIWLAGELAVTGFVYERQAFAEANTHGVLVQGQSLPGDTTLTSIMEESSSLNGKNLIEQAKVLFRPYNIGVVAQGEQKWITLPFDRVQISPGESPSHFIEKQARKRAAFVGDDENGNLVIHGGNSSSLPSGAMAALIEGENIQWERSTIIDLEAMSMGLAFGESYQNDPHWGKKYNRSKYVVMNPKVTRYKPYKFQVENTLNPLMFEKELEIRAKYEMAWRDGTQVILDVGVYGWLKPTGGLWKCGPDKAVSVHAPMMMITEDLICREVTFKQDNQEGTMTVLKLVNQAAYNASGVAFQ